MMELQGKYGTAKVFTDNIDSESIAQIIGMLNQEFSGKETIRMMPDVHAGAGCTIGTTMTLHGGKVVPNLVGVDIGCGVLVTELGKEDALDYEKLDNVIRTYVPSGMSVRDVPLPDFEKYMPSFLSLRCLNHVNIDYAKVSGGTLGGGNHYIEIDVDDEGTAYLVVHTGSRHLGLEVCKYYQNEGAKRLSGPTKEQIREVTSKLKAEGRQTEIPDALKKLQEQNPSVPKDLAYCSGDLMLDYLHDMNIVQEYAKLNRANIAKQIIWHMGWTVQEQFESIHNYIDVQHRILRKGAVSAYKGEKLIIPINMRDGALICIGKGNSDWNYSAPHGAGRVLSRGQAKQAISMEDYRKAMEGIYSTSVNESTLDESPFAYKGIESIVENIGDTVEIIKQVKPTYNFKASV